MTRVEFLTRRGCHLCEVALEQVLLARTVEPFELVQVDVDEDPELRAEYGDQIPVVLIDGRQHSFFSVEPGQLIESVRAAGNPRIAHR